MKVLALVDDPGGACYRYRWNAYAWALAKSGFNLDAVRWGKSWQRLQAIVAASRADIVILQRRLLPKWQLAILRRVTRTLIYDFDDALFRRDSYCGKAQRNKDRLVRFSATLRAADGIIAGNEYLRQFAAAQTDRRRVHRVPTCVQHDWYPAAEHRNTGAASKFVWIGQRCMLPSLQAAHDHLLSAANQLGRLQLDVICDSLPQLPGLDIALTKWSSGTEATDLAAADVGISWLPDDPWSLGKCGLKVLQYMAAGLPVIANPVGIHRELVEHGQTGFLAETQQDWAQAAALLADDPALRKQMGERARKRVCASYSTALWGPRLAAILGNIAARNLSNEPDRRGAREPATISFEPLAQRSATIYNRTPLPGVRAW